MFIAENIMNHDNKDAARHIHHYTDSDNNEHEPNLKSLGNTISLHLNIRCVTMMCKVCVYVYIHIHLSCTMCDPIHGEPSMIPDI